MGVLVQLLVPGPSQGDALFLSEVCNFILKPGGIQVIGFSFKLVRSVLR